jgi:hypothetical protein
MTVFSAGATPHWLGKSQDLGISSSPAPHQQGNDKTAKMSVMIESVTPVMPKNKRIHDKVHSPMLGEA